MTEHQQVTIRSPSSLEELGEFVGTAYRAGSVIAARGGGSKWHWGGPIERLEVLIDTEGLCSMDHAREDQTVVVGAGHNFAKLQEILSKAGQRISLDPGNIDGRATIGGVVATGDAGPLRFRYGSPRELIIGARLAICDGTVAHSGGTVIKNVAGFDVAKLVTGSYGTLGVIGEVAFRVHPLPEASLTVVSHLSPFEATTVVGAILGSVVEAHAIEYGMGRLVLLLEGSSKGVKAQAEKAVTVIRGCVSGARIDMEDAALGHAVWDEFSQLRSSKDVLHARLSTRVNALGKVHALAQTHSTDNEVTVVSHAGSGVHDLLVSNDSGTTGSELVKRLRAAFLSYSQPLVIRSAPGGLSSKVDLIGSPAPSAIALMQEVKGNFDPSRLMAPGRFRPWW